MRVDLSGIYIYICAWGRYKDRGLVIVKNISAEKLDGKTDCHHRVDRSVGWSISCQVDIMLDWLLDMGLRQVHLYVTGELIILVYSSCSTCKIWHGGIGEEWWDNTVAARIVIVMWCQNPQVGEKSTHAFREPMSFSEGFFSEWFAV